jgi:polar amino acid transport system substrate-binding protein
MVRKRHRLLDAATHAITSIKRDGTMAALHKKCFGTDAEAESTIPVQPLPER